MINRLGFEHLIGLSVGFILANQSIRSVTGYSFGIVFFLCLFAFVSFKYLLSFHIRIYNLKRLNSDDLIFSSLFILLFTYASISLLFIEQSGFIQVAELLAMFFFFLVGRDMKPDTLKAMVVTVIIMGLVASLAIIFYRPLVYSRGVNYLLMSFMVGLLPCLSVIFLILRKRFKILYIILMLIGFKALFMLQSRAVFLFVFLFVGMVPLFLCTKKGRLYYLLLVILGGLVIFIQFRDTILFFYNNSHISRRMGVLFSNFGDEQRFTTYGVYFEKFKEFFFTGYGPNGTSDNIYAFTIEKYPHNFILEFISEYGFIGFVFSCFAIFRSFLLIIKNMCRNVWIMSFAAMYLFYLMNFMKSFSIYDAFPMLLLIGLAFNRGLYAELKKKITVKTEQATA